MSEGMSRIVASLVRMLERPFNEHYRASEELLGMWLSFSLLIKCYPVCVVLLEVTQLKPRTLESVDL